MGELQASKTALETELATETAALQELRTVQKELVDQMADLRGVKETWQVRYRQLQEDLNQAEFSALASPPLRGGGSQPQTFWNLAGHSIARDADSPKMRHFGPADPPPGVVPAWVGTAPPPHL